MRHWSKKAILGKLTQRSNLTQIPLRRNHGGPGVCSQPNRTRARLLAPRDPTRKGIRGTLMSAKAVLLSCRQDSGRQAQAQSCGQNDQVLTFPSRSAWIAV